MHQRATKGFLDQGFIKRWPSAPKVIFNAAPNCFADEITKRFSIDLGVPIVSMNQLVEQVRDRAGQDEEFSHKFFLRARDMIEAGDQDALVREKIYIKLLRLTAAAQEGFVLTDFPKNVAQAELLEEYKGGMNAFVNISMPDEVLVDIEASKVDCQDCGRTYYNSDVILPESGIRVERFMPADGNCDDCGSSNFGPGSNPAQFEQELADYKAQKDDLLAFYNHFGLLVDFELRNGYQDYEKVKRAIQYNLKH